MNSRFFNAKQSKKPCFWHLRFNMNTRISHKLNYPEECTKICLHETSLYGNYIV